MPMDRMTLVHLLTELTRVTDAIEQAEAAKRQLAADRTRYFAKYRKRRLFWWWDRRLILRAIAVWAGAWVLSAHYTWPIVFGYPGWYYLERVVAPAALVLPTAIPLVHNLLLPRRRRADAAKDRAYLEEQRRQIAAQEDLIARALARYTELGGGNAFPAAHLNRATVRSIRGIIENHRADSITEAFQVLDLRKARRANARRQRAHEAQMRRYQEQALRNQQTAMKMQVLDNMSTRWAIQDALRGR